MSRKQQRQETIFFVLFCYIAGAVLVAYGYYWGIALLGLGFYLTLLLSSAVREATKSVLRGLARLVQKQVENRRNASSARTSTQPQPPQASPPLVTEAQSKSTYDEVVSRLMAWRPARRFNDERQSEVATQQYLHTYFPDQVRYHKFRENFESDLEISDIGIEIKVLYKTSELQRLGGQLMAYCEHFNHVIALIFNYNRLDLASYLRQWQKRFGSQVAVIVKES